MSLSSMASRTCSALLILVSFYLIIAPARAGEHLPAAIDVVVSNSSNSALLWANFDGTPPAAVQLNTDANQSSGLGSLAFHYNTCPGDLRLDVVAANTNGGDLLLYRGGTEDWATGDSICTGGNCPQRPTGLAASNARLLAAANSGGAGTVPELWFFEPAACGSAVFESGVPGGQFEVQDPDSVSSLATAVGEITDTEFVRVFGGGLEVGDLLVATKNPSVIARVRAEDIAKLLLNPQYEMPAADILVPASFFGSSSPAALAFVPGTSGVGSLIDQTSESENLLVTVPPGKVLNLSFGSTDFWQASLQGFVYFTEGLGNGPLGIAAGTSDGKTYMVVTDRQKGQVIRAELQVLENGDLAPPTPGNVDVLKANLQFPLGLDFNSNATDAGKCAATEGGCAIAGAIQLYLPEEQPISTLVATQQVESEDQIVIGQLFLFADTRGTANTPLPLPGLGGDFKLPGACRGFDLDDDPTTLPVVPVVNVTANFEGSPGSIMQMQELLEGIFPQLEDCPATGGRIYHHPVPGELGFDTPENGALIDKTVQCNASRGVNDPFFSPFAICSDLYYTAALGGNLSNSQKSALKTEVFGRMARLETVVRTLPPGPLDGLRSDLLAKLDEIRNILKKPRPSAQEYEQASVVFSAGANEVVQVNKNGGFAATTTPTYGNLFTRWLALAFYTHETGAMKPGPYCSPHEDVLAELNLDNCGP